MSLTSHGTTPRHGYARHVDLDADALARFSWPPDEYHYGRLSVSTSMDAQFDACGWALAHTATDRLLEAERTILTIILSELVANAVRHAGIDDRDAIDVHLGVADSGFRLEVYDSGSGFALRSTSPVLRELPWRRGLLIVDAVASRWGAGALVPGHCVWVEVDRPIRHLRAV